MYEGEENLQRVREYLEMMGGRRGYRMERFRDLRVCGEGSSVIWGVVSACEDRYPTEVGPETSES